MSIIKRSAATFSAQIFNFELILQKCVKFVWLLLTNKLFSKLMSFPYEKSRYEASTHLILVRNFNQFLHLFFAVLTWDLTAILGAIIFSVLLVLYWLFSPKKNKS